ncbi:MAG: hypothetical protein J6U23_14625 [Clostridiales bacterium]|nr:hypothetical protein [Clostridiales bacterium]
MDENRTKKDLLITATAIYIIVSSIAIFSAWIRGLASPFYMGYTVSVYVGLQKWTAAVYFVGIVIDAVILGIILAKTKLNILTKIAYYVTIVFLVGLAWFPVQLGRPESLASRGHNVFSYAFFTGVIVTLGLMLLFSRKTIQRIYAVCGVLFGTYYILGYIFKPAFFTPLVLFWETMLIYFYIGEYMLMIRSEEQLKSKSDLVILQYKA